MVNQIMGSCPSYVRQNEPLRRVEALFKACCATVALLVLLGSSVWGDAVHNAVIAMDIEELGKLISASPAHVNAADKNGATLLHWAAAEDWTAGVELLISKKANVNARKKDGVTAIHIAASMGHEEVVGLLLQYGADARAEDKRGRTPLSLAAAGRHAASARLLLSKVGQALSSNGGLGGLVRGGRRNLPVPAELRKIFAPVVKAAERGDVATVRKLLEKNPKLVNGCDASGTTPIHVAAADGRMELLWVLVSFGADIDAATIAEQTTPLMYAAANGREELVRTLVGLGASVNNVDKFRRWSTALHQAAGGGSRRICEFLIASGADVNARVFINSATPLHIAAQYGRTEVVELLISSGANVNAASAANTPLHIASAAGQKRIVELLIAKGARLDCEDVGGFTPLHDAACHGYLEVVEALVNAGAPLNARTRLWTKEAEGKSVPARSTPLGAAIVLGKNDVADFLRKRGAVE
ncbi:MAG: ankyrin repeat domain-containing protein [Armatimonadota bacterium]|nr:ankyrin repeat domain-containing protein [Armatimonadota bacterium]